MKHLLVAAAIAAITLLGVFVFPGHTWLQSDTQIYLPMFERMWDASLYTHELVVSRPHLAWTLYDETALALRAITGLDFEHVLLFEQILFRALGVWGIYLIGRRFTESPPAALLTAAIVSLGATIVGPAVLTVEYEPVPRGFALGLLFCAIGLAVNRKTLCASVAASCAFLYHAPTTFPFWIVFAFVIFRSQRWTALIPPVAAGIILLLFARFQPGVAEAQSFFTRIDPELEALQRMRASYNWVSLWTPAIFVHYAFRWGVSVIALVRLRAKMDATARLIFAGLPLIGVLSIPASYLLLEQMKWSLIPQFQPARAVLFVTAVAVILATLAAADAAARKRYAESAAWFLLPFIIPIHPSVIPPLNATQIALAAGLAALAVWAASPTRLSSIAVGLVVLTAALAIPRVGHVANYPRIHSAGLDDLSTWARTSTSKDSIFLFPDAGKQLIPGIFRVQALRAVYVDWKTGGQANYFRDLGMEWWARWQAVMVRHETPPEVDYLIYSVNRFPNGANPVYRNGEFVVVRAK